MATAPPTPPATNNFYQRLATQQTAAATRTLPEQIFHDAVDEVLKRKAKKKTELLRKLRSIHNEEEMQQQLENEFQNSNFFGPGASTRISRKVSKVAEHIWHAKPFLDKFMQINQSAAMPFWGVMLFVVMVVRNIHLLDGLLEKFRVGMEGHLLTFKEHFMRHSGLSESLKNALRAFYVSIITYCVEVSPLLKASTIKIYAKNYAGVVKSGLDGLIENMEIAAAKVYQVGGAETHSGVKALMYAQIEANDTAAAASAPRDGQAGPRRIESIPWAMTPCFTGRERTLNEMKIVLGPWEHDRPREVALWALPGAGKSQTSLRLSKSSSLESSLPFYHHVIFIRAYSLEVIKSEIIRVMMKIRPKDTLLPTMDISHVTQKLNNWFEANERWLLIFDNVQDASHVQAFKPQHGKGHIIYNTRSEDTAIRVCSSAANTVEMRPMNETDGRELVENLMGSHYHAQLENDAREIANYCRGLPLAIEMLVNFALTKGLGLGQALAVAKKKQQILKLEMKDSFHEHNPSVGAILVTTFDMLQQQYPMAGSLFKLLVHMEPSSIPVSQLPTASQMQEYLVERTETYDRGCVRTEQGAAERKKWIGHQKFDLLDYDPFSADIWLRLFHRGVFDKKWWQPGLPRIDSPGDVATQEHWESDGMLRHALSDRIQLDKALNQLQDSGLLRRIQMPADTYWIHDLFAEVMIAYIASESREASQTTAQLATTMVFLAFPIPHMYHVAMDRCSLLLPHAQSCIKHLREARIFNDATVGAELSHMVASAIYLHGLGQGRSSNAKPVSQGLETAIEYYKLALSGYTVAWKRLQAQLTSNIGKEEAMEKTIIATLADYAWEEGTQPLGKGAMFYVTIRHLHRTERFGSSAPWRCVQTCLKLGVMYAEAQDWDTANWYTQKGVIGTESLFGKRHWETESIKEFELELYERMGRWDKAYKVAEEQVKRFTKYWGGLGGDLKGAELATNMGRCCVELGRWHEAVRWHTLSWESRCKVLGELSKFNFGPAKNLARSEVGAGNEEIGLHWWCVALTLVWLSEDANGKEWVRDVDGVVREWEACKRRIKEKNQGKIIGLVKVEVDLIQQDVEKWREARREVTESRVPAEAPAEQIEV